MSVAENTNLAHIDQSRPVIEHYSDYRQYLRDMYEYRKQQPGGYTFRQMAKEAGIRSAGFINLVFSDRRNISQENAKGLARALRLTKQELTVLRSLVELNQSTDPVARRKLLRLLVQRPRFREHFQIDEDMLDYLEHWYVVAIQELASMKGFRASPSWISQELSPPITKRQASEALDVLLRLGLIVKNPDGSVVPGAGNIETPDELHHEVVRCFHVQTSDLAKWALAHIDPADRNFGAVTAAVKQDDFCDVLEFIHKQRKELTAYLERLRSDDADTLMQINYQAFPLTSVDGASIQEETS